jgi:hypothetical protein
MSPGYASLVEEGLRWAVQSMDLVLRSVKGARILVWASPNNFERTYDCAKPIRSAGGRDGGYRGAAEKHLQLVMGQALD